MEKNLQNKISNKLYNDIYHLETSIYMRFKDRLTGLDIMEVAGSNKQITKTLNLL